MITKSGLIGVYQPPLVGNQTNSIYMLTDETTQTLFVLILYPGSYDDIYKIASLTWYRNIILVPVSLGSYFISDIVRLVQDLTAINKKVSVLSPDKFPVYVPKATQISLIRGMRSILSFDEGFITFDYKMTDKIYEDGFHDIYLSFKGRRFLFCPLEVNEDRVSAMLSSNLVDFVYVPYNDPMFGTTAYLSIIKNETFDGLDRHFLAIGFKDQTAANFCRLHYPYSYPMTYKYAFANSVFGITDKCDQICIGESEVANANSCYIINNQDSNSNSSVKSDDEVIDNKCSCANCPKNKVELPPRPEEFIPPTGEKPPHSMPMPEIEGTITIPEEVTV